ncbi:restriction endonuclease subunit S [Ancylobacter lacus]|uniref:restriction endonuclease subunit S n=1 Tax=Ancylobacter lacus TaxID=2579970 RepID=UPI001BCF3AFF|nr:restriction endonuclease subunit S [Ancylobacter lacus]
MSDWPLRELSEAVEINPRTPKGIAASHHLSFVPMAAVDEIHGAITDRQAREFGAVSKGFPTFANGDVLFAKITPCMENGKAAIASDLVNGIGAGSTEFFVLRPRPNVLPEYIFHFVRRSSFRETCKANFTGSAGQQRVPRSYLERVMIPLPPLDEQRRIVGLLDRAAEIRRRADAARAKARAIIPALFLDMFGDPATNPKGWEERRLGDLAAKMSDGPFGSNLKSEHYRDSGVRVWRLQNIGVGQVRDDDKAYISEDHFRMISRHECLPGDVIIGTLGEPNLRAIIQPKWISRAINKADCVQFRPKDSIVTSEYIAGIMNQKGMLARCSGQIAGQTRSRISMGRLREISIPLPPLSLQAAFAEQANRLDALARALDAAAAKADSMAAALSAEVFG